MPSHIVDMKKYRTYNYPNSINFNEVSTLKKFDFGILLRTGSKSGYNIGRTVGGRTSEERPQHWRCENTAASGSGKDVKNVCSELLRCGCALGRTHHRQTMPDRSLGRTTASEGYSPVIQSTFSGRSPVNWS